MGGSHPHPAHSSVVSEVPGYRSSTGVARHYRSGVGDEGGGKGSADNTYPAHLSRQNKKQSSSNPDSPNGKRRSPSRNVTNTGRGGGVRGGGGIGGPPLNGLAMTSRPKLRGVGLKRQNGDDAASDSEDGSPRRRQLHRTVTSALPHHDDDDVLFDYVRNSVVGKDLVLNGPFGQRTVLYLDYVASGKPLTFIEEYITKEVLPTYANTHTTTSATARQTTLFRNEARAIIRRAVNGSDDDAVIFTGNGVTGTVHKLIHALNFTEPPVVFVGPFEHHSNILPWRELHADVIRIPQSAEGLVDQESLEEELQKWSGSGRRLVGSFSAGSNVTGILVDTVAISTILHRHGAIALWDYATAAPYVRIDMNPAVDGEDHDLAYKDAVFISPHKFVGGVDTPGLLIAKKHLFHNEVPHHCGGGTVLLVRQTGHRYLQNVEEREEGGTPSIVGAIRAGLIFQLKEAITPERIMRKEQELFSAARDFWARTPNLIILGNTNVERIPVFSFLVHHPTTGYYLHHNFVACLLNDLFGIQARGGCACAGPYAMDLLGITEDIAMGIEQLLITQSEDRESKSGPQHKFGDSEREIFKPGFTRLNLPYFLSDQQVDFVLQAVAMVAEHGWKLLPQYKFNPKTGEWKHEHSQESKQQKHLDQLSYAHGCLEVTLPRASGDQEDTLPQNLQECLQEARVIFDEAEKNMSRLPDQSHLFEDFAQSSRWFLLPSEASEVLHAFSHIKDVKPAIPFVVPNQNQGGPSPHHQNHHHHQQSSPTHILDIPARGGGGGGGGGGSRGSKVTVASLGSSLGSQPGGGGGSGGGGKDKKSPRYVRKIKVNGYQGPPPPASSEDPSSADGAPTGPTKWKY